MCNDLYLGKYDRNSDTPEPDGVNVQSRRDFIRNKYVERRWYGTAEDLVREIEERTRKAEERERAKSRLHRRASSRKSFDSSTGSEGTPAVQPITRVLPGVQVQVNKQVPSNDLLDLLSAPSGAPAAVDQSGWGAFQDSQPLQTMMNAVPAAEPQVSSGLAPPPPPPQQAKPGFYLGFPAPPQSQQSPFGALAVQQPQQVVYQQQPQAFSPGFSPFEVQHAPQQQNFGPPALQAPPSFQQFPAAPAVVGTQQQQQPQQLGFTAGFGAFPPPPSGTQAQQLQHARSLSVASTGSLGGGIGAPQVAASHLRVPSQDPFADLSATSAQEVPSFAKGEKCMYQKGGEQHPAVIIKVHLDGGNPPFYSVQLLHTGQEKNTDHHHLLKLANTVCPDSPASALPAAQDVCSSLFPVLPLMVSPFPFRNKCTRMALELTLPRGRKMHLHLQILSGPSKVAHQPHQYKFLSRMQEIHLGTSWGCRHHCSNLCLPAAILSTCFRLPLL